MLSADATNGMGPAAGAVDVEEAVVSRELLCASDVDTVCEEAFARTVDVREDALTEGRAAGGSSSSASGLPGAVLRIAVVQRSTDEMKRRDVVGGKRGKTGDGGERPHREETKGKKMKFTLLKQQTIQNLKTY